VVNYENAQNGNPYGPGIGTAEQFLSEGEDDVSPLGIRLRPDRRRLKSGEMAAGLLVLSVTSGGPAAKAGVKPYRHTARTTLEVFSVAGAFFFPPAMFLLPVLESTSVGDSYDMIVGVDGFRVTSALDFEDCMRDVQPGEIVYLSLVRNGQRVQVPVSVPNLPQ
jgi:S1-C subfamily serine protease